MTKRMTNRQVQLEGWCNHMCEVAAEIRDYDCTDYDELTSLVYAMRDMATCAEVWFHVAERWKAHCDLPA